jgi:chloride channel protein, CIC family
MLQGGMPPASSLLLLAVKAVIWAIALGSGTSGGVLAPLLIMGGAMGATLAHVLPTASPGFWALLTMAATMGGTMRSPLTATFFAAEITGNTHVLLPLLTACMTAHLLTVLLLRRSILTEKVARRGHHLSRKYRVDPFTLTRSRDIMTTDVQTVPAFAALASGAGRSKAAPSTRRSFQLMPRGAIGKCPSSGRCRFHAPREPAALPYRRVPTGSARALPTVGVHATH